MRNLQKRQSRLSTSTTNLKEIQLATKTSKKRGKNKVNQIKQLKTKKQIRNHLFKTKYIKKQNQGVALPQQIHNIDLIHKYLLKTDLDTLSCSVCLQVLVFTSVTQCGHSFCRKCLQFSLLIKPECPLCRNYLNLDKYIQSSNTDRLIKSILQSKHDLSLKQYNQRVLIQQKMFNQTILKQELKIGDIVDYQSEQFGWIMVCVFQKDYSTYHFKHFLKNSGKKSIKNVSKKSNLIRKPNKFSNVLNATNLPKMNIFEQFTKDIFFDQGIFKIVKFVRQVFQRDISTKQEIQKQNSIIQSQKQSQYMSIQVQQAQQISEIQYSEPQDIFNYRPQSRSSSRNQRLLRNQDIFDSPRRNNPYDNLDSQISLFNGRQFDLFDILGDL